MNTYIESIYVVEIKRLLWEVERLRDGILGDDLWKGIPRNVTTATVTKLVVFCKYILINLS